MADDTTPTPYVPTHNHDKAEYKPDYSPLPPDLQPSANDAAVVEAWHSAQDLAISAAIARSEKVFSGQTDLDVLNAALRETQNLNPQAIGGYGVLPARIGAYVETYDREIVLDERVKEPVTQAEYFDRLNALAVRCKALNDLPWKPGPYEVRGLGLYQTTISGINGTANVSVWTCQAISPMETHQPRGFLFAESWLIQFEQAAAERKRGEELLRASEASKPRYPAVPARGDLATTAAMSVRYVTGPDGVERQVPMETVSP